MRDDHRVATTLGNADIHNLLAEAPARYGSDGALVADERQFVLILAADLESFRDILRRHAHVVAVDRAAKPLGHPSRIVASPIRKPSKRA
ncbi:hypothetical protein GBAR_LOCUS11889 [Geodia barretti]|uniref:Uncharacterized protein n=1 Tax=Geodia barretti TaxID=519541 RepID=A0AA35WFR8_GEOBA|nr:hypothetical protein GBAR_LOCUS11889 [Geodia barretti]